MNKHERTQPSTRATRLGKADCDRYQFLMEQIPCGKANGISMMQLAIQMNMSERELRKHIHDARCAGYIIASGNTGYYIPENDTELLECHRRLRSMHISGLSALSAIRKQLKQRGIDPDGKAAHNEK